MSRAVPKIGEAGYERVAFDNYRTPPWVTELLCAKVRLRNPIWEPCVGDEDMQKVLEDQGYHVTGTDIRDPDYPLDFLGTLPFGNFRGFQSIVTNPPYVHAEAFIRRALDLTKETDGQVVMLLGFEFDTAASRMDLFKHPAFAAKLTLGKRITWLGFEEKASPRQNHAWFIWDWQYAGPPRLIYP